MYKDAVIAVTPPPLVLVTTICRLSETIAAVVFDVKEGSINLKMDDDGAIPKSEQAWLAELMTGDCGPMQSDVRIACRMLAHNGLGPIREERSLKEALAEYERIECEDVPTMRIDPRARGSNKIRGDELESALSVRNLALLGRILAFAASRRTESRSAHFRLDYPDTDDVRWRVVTRLQSGANNAIELYADPVKESAASGLHR